ncbi:Protein TsgA [Buchnera aphidicola (Symydobius americanus)]
MTKDKIGLTLISFLSYYFIGSIITITGILMKSIARYFHVSMSEISSTFTYLNLGILISILLNSWITNFISLNKQILTGFIFIIPSILGLAYSNNIATFCISIFILGLVGGMTMSIGTFLITCIYNGKNRTSKLLITDSFFSLSGMTFPIIASYFIKHDISWYWIYIMIAMIYFLILIISLNVNFPNHIIYNQKKKYIKQEKYQINISILTLCFAALLYILGQLGFISWIPEYLIQNININIQTLGKLISNFWMSYMIGMWFFSYILNFFDLQKSLLYLTSISTILMYLIIHTKNIQSLIIIMIMLGFFSSAIYTIIITLTALQKKNVSHKLINLILTSGTFGTLLTFIITSPIVSHFGIYITLTISNILYGIISILSWTLKFSSNHTKNL